MVISGVRAEQPSFEPTPSTPALHAVSAEAQAEPEVESPFSRAMRGLGREIDVGERQVAGASQLRSYDTGTLIALQAGIYRYTEAVDLASKIVDRASTAVHTVLSGGGH
jgi:hypothetical protein